MDSIAHLIAASAFAQGVFTWAFPLVVFLAVVIWYVLLVRHHHPD